MGGSAVSDGGHDGPEILWAALGVMGLVNPPSPASAAAVCPLHRSSGAAALADGISGCVVEVVMADIRPVGCRSAIWTGVPLTWTASCTVNQQRMGWLDRAPSAFFVSRAVVIVDV